MASKGQKFNKYIEEMINEVLEELKLGKSNLQISKKKIFQLKQLELGNLKNYSSRKLS